MTLKLKLQQLISISNDLKSTLRWLHRSNSNLWEEILITTSFLPDDASAPRRVWHIINDVYHIPLCSLSKIPLGWHCFEHGYKKYGDKKVRYKGISDSLKESIDKNGHWRTHDPKKAEKANEKFSKGFNEGLHKPWNERDRNYQEITRKAQKTCLDRYGVDNYRKTKDSRENNSKLAYERYLANGGIPRELRPKKEAYYAEAWIHTNKSWYEHFHDINPDAIQRGDAYHLDHVYSIQQGFINDVPPEIIGHWTNLRLLDERSNKSKRNKCDKTINQLYEDYNNNQNH